MKKKKVNPEDIVKYGISNLTTIKELAIHFGVSLTTLYGYLAEVREANPDLLRKFECALEKRNAINIPTLIRNYNLLMQENGKLKDRIALLEQELQGQRTGIQPNKQVTQKQQIQRGTKHPNESEFDVLIKVFNRGSMTASEAEVLLQFQHKLEKIKQAQLRSDARRDVSHYTYMISTIKIMLATNSAEYKENRFPYLMSFITADFAIDAEISIGRLVGVIEKNAGKKIYQEELMLIINRLITEGRGNEISKKINTEAIGNKKNGLEWRYEQIVQDGLLFLGER